MAAMSYKVIRNIADDVVAFGPNDEGYEPVIPDGGLLYIEKKQPSPSVKIVALHQIQLLESQTMLPRVTREFIIGAVKTEAEKTGLDPMALPAYVKLKTLDDQIKALRAQL